MSKRLIKIRELKNYTFCFSCGNFPNLARKLNPIGYHAGDLGWNFDLCINGWLKNDNYITVALTLGYRCRGIKDSKVSALCRKYDKLPANSYDAYDFYKELEKIIF